MKNFFRLPIIIGALPVTLTNGTTADATQVMSDLNWIVNQTNSNAAPLATTALTNANNNFTVVQSGIAASAAANFPIASQVQNSVFTTFQSTLGTNALTARCAALALTTWPTDAVFSFIPSQTNTGPSNITVDSAGSSIIFSMGSTLVGGELRAGVPAFVKRDATKLNLQNPANVRFDLSSASTAGGVRILIANTPRLMTLGKQPTTQTFLSGSGAYTTPPEATRIEVQLIGGGGGGGGTAADGSPAGSAGGDTTFFVLTGSGGGGGVAAGGGPSSGGVGTGGDINFPGSGGSSGAAAGSIDVFGGSGGNGFFGGGAAGAGGNQGGVTASTNTGGGGSGHGGNGAAGGGGGGAGGYCRKRIVAPAPTYSYSVGAAGAAATSAGTGAAGIIIIDEYYN